jgi:hypothetical protein
LRFSRKRRCRSALFSGRGSPLLLGNHNCRRYAVTYVNARLSLPLRALDGGGVRQRPVPKNPVAATRVRTMSRRRCGRGTSRSTRF